MYTITVNDLEKLYKKNEKRLRQGKSITEYETRLTIAAGHALDLIETAKHAKGYRLDLREETMDNVPYVLTLRGIANRTVGKLSDEETIADLIKKAASYEMFLLCSAFNDGEISTCEIKLSPDTNDLVLCAKNLNTEAEATIDLYDVYARAQSGKKVFSLVSSDMVGVHTGLASDIIYEEFFKPLRFVDVL